MRWASFGSTAPPSALCGLAFVAPPPSSTVACVTDPKPLESLVFGSLISIESGSIPHCPEWLLRLSSVVSKLSPPMKSFHSCLGALGGSDRHDCSGGGRLQRCLLSGVHGQRAHTGLLKKHLGQIPLEAWDSPPNCYTHMRDFTFSEEGCDRDCCSQWKFASSGPSREEQWGPFFI